MKNEPSRFSRYPWGSCSGVSHRDEIALNRDAVRARLDRGLGWQDAARDLGVSPGLAFMIQTGVPADGSGSPELGERVGQGEALASPQSLVNPRGHNPLRNESVEAWIRTRAARELS